MLMGTLTAGVDPLFDNIEAAEAQYASEIDRTGGIGFDIGLFDEPWRGGGFTEASWRSITLWKWQRGIHEPWTVYLKPIPERKYQPRRYPFAKSVTWTTRMTAPERVEARRIIERDVQRDKAKSAAVQRGRRRADAQIQLVADAYAALRRFHRGY